MKILWLVLDRSFNIFSQIVCLFVCIGVIIVRSARECFPDLDTPGWTIPRGDLMLEEGTELVSSCVLDRTEVSQKNYSSSQIFFELNNERVSSQYVTILNDTAAVMRLSNISARNNDWLYCYLEVGDATAARSSMEVADRNSLLVCSNFVAVGTKPKDVMNFSCYSYDWKTLNCSWIEPYDDALTEYEISYHLPKRGDRSTSYTCPDETLRDIEIVEIDDGIAGMRKSCAWTLHTSRPYRSNFEYLTFVITSKNRFGNHSQTINFHNYGHIIPSPPAKFQCLSKTVDSVQLQWDIDALSVFDKGWIYKISYTWNSSGVWNVTEYNHKDNVLSKTRGLVRLNVTGLKYPNMAYNFRVSMKSAVAPENVGWSEPSSLVVKTKPCPPYKSPRTDRGSFEISSVESTDNYRVVYLYWQPVNRLDYNGDNFTYDVAVYEDNVLVSNAQPLVPHHESYAKYRINFTSYRFVIRSKNAEGESKNASFIDIPNKNYTLRRPTIVSKVDYGQGVYELSWRAAKGVKNVNYTVFWCETDKEYPYQCGGFIDWERVRGDVNKFNLTTKNTTDGHDSIAYQFAVSALSENSSSGMTWATCTVLHDFVNKINDVWIDKIDSYYIFIRWKLECSNRVDGVKGYYIYSCPMEMYRVCSKNKEKTITVYGDLDTDHANITELEPYTHYQISIAMFTDNATGVRSDPLVNQTLDGFPDVANISFVSTASTNTSISLQWNPITKPNGVLRFYTIRYSYNNEPLEVPANTTSIVLEKLTSYHQYEIKLQACTLLCSQTVGPLKVTTRIGKPGSIEGLSTQNLNATHMVVEWNKLSLPGGPRPSYKIRLTYNNSNDYTQIREVNSNYTLLEKEICKEGQPLIEVRAVNKDEKTNQIFEGEWSKKLALTCPYEQGFPVTRIVLILFGVMLACFFVITLGRKFFKKCQDMKNVTVTLPMTLTVPAYKVDMKACSFYEDYNIYRSKSNDEIYNNEDKMTELSRFSSHGMISLGELDSHNEFSHDHSEIPDDRIDLQSERAEVSSIPKTFAPDRDDYTIKPSQYSVAQPEVQKKTKLVLERSDEPSQFRCHDYGDRDNPMSSEKPASNRNDYTIEPSQFEYDGYDDCEHPDESSNSAVDSSEYSDDPIKCAAEHGTSELTAEPIEYGIDRSEYAAERNQFALERKKCAGSDRFKLSIGRIEFAIDPTKPESLDCSGLQESEKV